ncbi:hypothetical protein PVAG01_01102 [Phlyctema vagabunda]|uniref:Uncharacterized protein n=1 Tax=Phlyctema vagabunda TaxID=108571 RepID=A0ABR4PW77_9HELO
MPGVAILNSQAHHPPSPSQHPLPFRDVNNQSLQYTTSVAPGLQYDSDMEPLVSGPAALAELDEDSLNRFTATGRPIPEYKKSGLSNYSDMYSLPHLLPKRYTDDSVIPAIITDVIPSPKENAPNPGQAQNSSSERPRRPSFLAKLKHDKPKPVPSVMTKVIFMPRGEYLKFFARDQKGDYIGSEPHRQWTEKELEERYGKFKPVLTKARKGWVNYVF